MMAEFFASARAVDLVLAVVVLEALSLAIYHARTRRGLAPRDYLANLVAGACLLLAVRAALTHAPWIWIAFFLVAALPAHVADLWRRARS